MNKFVKQLKDKMSSRVSSAVECLRDARKARGYADYVSSATVLEIARLSGLTILDSYLGVRLYEDEECTTLYFTVNCNNGLKTKGLTAVIAYLCEFVGTADSSDHVSDWSASRSFMFGEWKAAFRVQMECRIPADAKGCRKVAVGEKVETVMQYKIECDDDKI